MRRAFKLTDNTVIITVEIKTFRKRIPIHCNDIQ